MRLFEKSPTLVSPTREDIAYIAGFLDCDGSICVHRNQGGAKRQTSVQGRVAFYQKVEAPLGFIQSRYGGSIYYPNACYVLQITRVMDVQRILEDTLPYLRVKYKQAELMLSLCQYKLMDTGRVRSEFSPNKVREFEIADQIASLQEYKAKTKKPIPLIRSFAS